MSVKTMLSECLLFFDVNSSGLEKIASITQQKEFDAGTTLFSAGDSAVDLFVIEEGRVAIQMSLPKMAGHVARRITVDVVSKNEIVGWSAIVEPFKFSFNTICMQHTKVLSINAAKLRDMLNDDPALGYDIMKNLTKILAVGLNDTRQILIAERLMQSQE